MARLKYRMCRQTVTLYRKVGESVEKTVIGKAYLDFKKNQNVEKTGSREANSFLLVIPGNSVQIKPGDKVISGVGPDVTAEEWGGFIPSKAQGLVVVSYVDPKYYGNRIVHWEAGG